MIKWAKNPKVFQMLFFFELLQEILWDSKQVWISHGKPVMGVWVIAVLLYNLDTVKPV